MTANGDTPPDRSRTEGQPPSAPRIFHRVSGASVVYRSITYSPANRRTTIAPAPDHHTGSAEPTSPAEPRAEAE
jgi:hypothetical protein